MYPFQKKGDYEESLIRILISELRDPYGYWVSDKKKGEGIISSDFITLGNEKYLETFGVDFSNGSYYMYREVGRIVGPRQKHFFKILYVQSISSDKAFIDWSLKSWTGKSGLNAEQLEVFNVFVEDSQRNVQIN